MRPTSGSGGDWKVPDPTQRRSAITDTQSIDITKIAKKQRQETSTKIALGTGIFFLTICAVAVAVYLALHPEILSPDQGAPAFHRIEVEWLDDAQGRELFEQEWSNARQARTAELRTFSRRFWIFEESKHKPRTAEGTLEQIENQQADYWREFRRGRDVMALEMDLAPFISASTGESDRFRLTVSRDESELPDGGLRRVDMTSLIKLSTEALSAEQRAELAGSPGRARVLLAPYYIEPSSRRETVRAIELTHDLGRDFKAMNSWVNVVNAELLIYADIVGFELLPDGGEPLLSFKLARTPG